MWKGCLLARIKQMLQICKKKKNGRCISTQLLVPGNSWDGWGLSDVNISDQSSTSDLVDVESRCRNWRVSSPATRVKQVREQLIEPVFLMRDSCAIPTAYHTLEHTYLRLGYGTASCLQSVWNEGLGGQSWSWPGGSGPECAHCTGTWSPRRGSDVMWGALLLEPWERKKHLFNFHLPKM